MNLGLHFRECWKERFYIAIICAFGRVRVEFFGVSKEGSWAS